MTKKIVVIATEGHPLYNQSKELAYKFYDLDKDEPFEERRSHYLDADFIVDLTILSPPKKHKLLQSIALLYDIPILSDLGPYWVPHFLDRHPKLSGAFNLSMSGNLNKFESIARNETIKESIIELGKSIDKTPLFISEIDTTFPYPRIVSMIINEAYFAMEQGQAESEAIDMAMTYGVNYPEGPFALGERIGLDKVCYILELMQEITGDGRYKTSYSLKRAAYQKPTQFNEVTHV